MILIVVLDGVWCNRFEVFVVNFIFLKTLNKIYIFFMLILSCEFLRLFEVIWAYIWFSNQQEQVCDYILFSVLPKKNFDITFDSLSIVL